MDIEEYDLPVKKININITNIYSISIFYLFINPVALFYLLLTHLYASTIYPAFIFVHCNFNHEVVTGAICVWNKQVGTI